MYSWNHHYFRLNDTSSDKVKFAYENIIEMCDNSTSKLVSNTIFWYPLRIILLIIIILILYKLYRHFKC